MGKTILIIAILIETIFTEYCMKTKDNQNRIRSWLRISSFLLFIALALISIIEWSFRWYSLFALLLVLAVIGGIRLLTKKFGKKTYKTYRVVLKGISMLMMVIFAIIPALIFPQYKLPKMTGNYEITSSVYTYTDNNRIETFTDTGKNRKVNVEFWYPANTEGNYPLIIFSHGAFGVKMSNTSTYMELASNGYVVCSVDHPYHAAGTMDTEGNLTIGSSEFMQEVIDANGGVYSDEEELEMYDRWMAVRTGDMNFIIDTITNYANSDKNDVYKIIDTDRIGLMGHSLGGAASTQLGRDRVDIYAVVNIDGTMLGEYQGFKDGKPIINNEPYTVPLLSFYSQLVVDQLEANPDYIYPNRYLSSISSDTFEVCISGSSHMSYTDLPLFSPMLANVLSGISGPSAQEASVDEYYCIETMNDLILKFFDCYIKGEGEFMVEEVY